MGMFDAPANPSDGRFEAPDPSRFEAPAPRRSRAWAIPLAGLLFYVVRFELDSAHPTGWLAAAVGIAAFGIGVADVIVAKKRRDEAELRSSSQHITR